MKKTRPKSLMREVAYDRFKVELFRRNLAPGQFVSQGELCELLDVPLGPTREALKRLEAENLVRLIPQRGIQIADIGVTLIHEAFQFRTILESAAIRHFVKSADDAVIAELDRTTQDVRRRMAAHADGKRPIDPKLLDAALQVDWHMHNLIVESVGNRILMTAHQHNFDKIKMIRLHGRSPRYLPLALEEHMAVIAALKSRDADQAAAALEHHLKSAERRALGM